jgi:hypothetical protein
MLSKLHPAKKVCTGFTGTPGSQKKKLLIKQIGAAASGGLQKVEEEDIIFILNPAIVLSQVVSGGLRQKTLNVFGMNLPTMPLH